MQGKQFLTDGFQYTFIQNTPEVIPINDDVQPQDYGTSTLFLAQRQGNWVFKWNKHGFRRQSDTCNWSDVVSDVAFCMYRI
jgi:hypothetical protein